jgi:hypothetical protein
MKTPDSSGVFCFLFAANGGTAARRPQTKVAEPGEPNIGTSSGFHHPFTSLTGANSQGGAEDHRTRRATTATKQERNQIDRQARKGIRTCFPPHGLCALRDLVSDIRPSFCGFCAFFRPTTSIIFQCLENDFAIHDFAKSPPPVERASLPEKIFDGFLNKLWSPGR